MRPGEIIAGRYEIQRPVRSGGISVVYKAEDRDSALPVAIKVISLHQADEAFTRRIEREIEILTRLEHPHIVRCLGSGTLSDERMYLVLEWLEGEDLADHQIENTWSLRTTLELVEQVADALGAAHRRGVIHRDIKPANIFLMSPEVRGPPSCRVIDFGVAKLPESSAALTRAGAILGTPSYMAPEQANFAMDVDARADIYSLGVVTYELITGRLPWTSQTDLSRLARILFEEAIPLHEVAPHVPDPVASLVDSMLANDLGQRVDNAETVRDVVRGCLDALPADILDRVHAGPRDRIERLVRAETMDVTPHPPQPAILVGGDEVRARDQVQKKDPSRITDAAVLPAAPSERTRRLDGALELIEEDLDESASTQALDALSADDREQLAAVPLSPDPGFEAATGEQRTGGGVFSELLSYVEHVPQSLLYGRVLEVERLRTRALAPAGSSRPNLTLVIGPAGIGKTRLRAELTKVLRGLSRPPRVLSGRAEETLRSTPYALLRRLLFAEANIHSDDPPDVKRDKMLSIIPSAGQIHAVIQKIERSADELTGAAAPQGSARTSFFTPELFAQRDPDDEALWVEEERAIVAAFTCEALQIPYPEIPPVTAARNDRGRLGEQVRRALEIVFRAVAEDGGAIVLVDDAHLLDPASARVLASLLDPKHAAGIALIAWALPNFLDAEVRDPSPLADTGAFSAEVMELLPLEGRAARGLARSLAPSALESAALELLVARAGGHPLYLEQLVGAVVESGMLMENDGELGLPPAQAGVPEAERIPPTVAAAVSTRISSLDPGQQKVLTAAAVFGEVFWAEGVAQLASTSIDQVSIELDRLLLGGFVRKRPSSRYRGETEMEFSHAVIRSVALSRLKRRRRQSFEELAGQYLAARGEGDGAVLATHAAQAGDALHAAQLYARAAEQSLAVGDTTCAITLVEEGLAAAEGAVPDAKLRRHLFELMEQIAVVDGDWERGRDALDALADLEGDAAVKANLLERRSRMAYLARRYEEARLEAAEAKRAFEAMGSKDGVARAELRHAEASEALGDSRAALRGYLAAQVGFGDSPASGGLARTARGLARIAITSGDYGMAENRFRAALVQSRTARDHAGVFEASVGLAEVARLVGETLRSRELIEDAGRAAFDRARKLRLRVEEAMLWAEERRFEDAIARLHRIYEAAEGEETLAGVRRHAALCAAQVLRRRTPGDDPRRDGVRLARVVSWLEEARQTAVTEEPALCLALEVALAAISAEGGQHARARELDEAVRARFDREGAALGDEPPWIHYAHARVLEQVGASGAEVRAAMRAAIVQLDSIGSRMERAKRQRYLDRWIGRAVWEEAERVGLSLMRDASSSRISARVD